MVKTIAQRKIDARTEWGWPYPIDHPNDERALYEGCYPDFSAARKIHKFYRGLLKVPREHRRVVRGIEQAPLKPFALLGWWFRDILAPLFAWKKPNGERRFRKAFCSTGKKSGKSTVLAGLPLFSITSEGTQQAEAYTTAVDRNQAGIIYRKVSWMVDHSAFAKVIRKSDSMKWLSHDRSGSLFRVLTPDAASAEGYNPNLLICDELHAWTSREFFEAIMYSQIARPNALFLMITTAGDDETGVGFDEYEKAKDLLNPDSNFYIRDHFAYVAEAAPDKKLSELDWDNPERWKEASPSLRCGAIGSIETLQAKAQEVARNPKEKRKFIRYICNRWVVEVDEPYIEPERWKLCAGAVPLHFGDDTYLGLDLAEREDLAALCMAWWSYVEGVAILDLAWKFWTPKETIIQHEHDWRVPLQDWINEDWITATEGIDIDYAIIRKAISGVELDEHGNAKPDRDPTAIDMQYNLVEGLRADPHNAKTLCEIQLEEADGITYIPHRQGWLSMNEPIKGFKSLVDNGRVRHGNNPVMNWMINHCVAPKDGAANRTLHKKKSRHKIDGVVAAVMAGGGAMAGNVSTDNEVSIF